MKKGPEPKTQRFYRFQDLSTGEWFVNPGDMFGSITAAMLALEIYSGLSGVYTPQLRLYEVIVTPGRIITRKDD